MIALWQVEVTSTLNICLNTEGECWDFPVVEIQLRQKWVESIHVCTNVAENYVLAFSVNLTYIKHGSWNQFSSTSRLLSSHHFLLIHSTQCKEQKLNKAMYTLGFSRESGKKCIFHYYPPVSWWYFILRNWLMPLAMCKADWLARLKQRQLTLQVKFLPLKETSSLCL